jgi:outer membrane immunogenic protein
MKKALLGTMALAALMAAPATAADLARPAPVYVPPPPVVVAIFSWTGFYIGANVGGHWGKDQITTTTAVANFPLVGEAAGIDAQSPASLTPNGFIGGLQAGVNWQFNSVVVGLEGDVNWLGGSTSRTLLFGVPVTAGDFISDSTKTNFLATIRPRLGIAFDRALPYITGGVAFGTVKTTDTLGVAAGTVLDVTNGSTSRTGWTVGGGLDYAFTNNWIGRIEYLYVNLGTFDSALACTFAPCVSASDTIVHHKYSDNIVRVGLNYKFGGF